MIGPLRLCSGMGGGAATRFLTAEPVKVAFRRPRPHERISAPPGYRAVIAVAATPDGPEEAIWHVPAREAKRALNPRAVSYGRLLAAGRVPDGWRIAS